MALIEGTSDYAPGPVRLSFLVVGGDGRPVERPLARVFVGNSLDAPPIARSTARLEPVGVLGGSQDPLDVTHLYVVHVTIPRPGTFALIAEPVGGSPIQAFGTLTVRKQTQAPTVGSEAIPSRTPTIRSAQGDLAALTTAQPPDVALLRTSVAEALAAHEPFVLTFATPAFCQSRTCGPVVDVVAAVARRLARTDARFIHVEIYEHNDPALGYNRWVGEWRLPKEPFTFLVGRDGRIKAKFEGSVSVDELTAAVNRFLVPRSVP